MSSWIWIAIAAYLLLAVNGIIDKVLLTNVVRKPIVYIFYNGIMAFVVLFLLPFGVTWLELGQIAIAMAGGALFSTALYFYYQSIQQLSISRVLPIQGGFVPLFTLGLGQIILHESLTGRQYLAFALLTAGAVLIAFKKEGSRWQLPALGLSIVAALFFAGHFVVSKYIYDAHGFVNGLFWTRWGMFAFVVLSLLWIGNRRAIFSAPKQTTSGHKLAFYSARAAGGTAGFLQNYAISLGSVTIVNALQGVQFLFVLLIASFFSVRYPKLIKEAITRDILTQKLVAIALVVSGLIFLT